MPYESVAKTHNAPYPIMHHFVTEMCMCAHFCYKIHYDDRAMSGTPGLQYPPLHGPVHTPDNNRWDTPSV